MAKQPGKTAKAANKPFVLRQIGKPPSTPLDILYEARETVCNGAQTGFQCSNYVPTVIPRLLDDGRGQVERVGSARERFCMLGIGGDQYLGNGGRKMVLECGRYAPGAPYDRVYEESPSGGRMGGSSSPSPDSVVAQSIAQVGLAEKHALATGRPMMSVAGEAKETRFQGPPQDGSFRAGGRGFLVQFWHQDERGWLAEVRAEDSAAVGPDRDTALNNVKAKVLAKLGITEDSHAG